MIGYTEHLHCSVNAWEFIECNIWKLICMPSGCMGVNRMQCFEAYPFAQQMFGSLQNAMSENRPVCPAGAWEFQTRGRGDTLGLGITGNGMCGSWSTESQTLTEKGACQKLCLLSNKNLAIKSKTNDLNYDT